jgi:hypothetical protein
MDTYAIWCDLAPGVNDLDFTDAVTAYLGHLKEHQRLAAFRIRRRKFGFGPDALGEFFIEIDVDNLAQLEEAFRMAVPREGEIEALHAAVFSRVVNFRSALYRDFPDPERVRPGLPPRDKHVV